MGGSRRSDHPNDPSWRALRAPKGHDAVRQHCAEYGHTGATLFEFAVSATVLGMVAVIFLGRLLTAEEQAEKSAMELSVSHMRAGLRAQVGALLKADRAAEIAALAGGDPTDWLELPPENYLGEFLGQTPTMSRGTGISMRHGANWSTRRTRDAISSRRQRTVIRCG